MKDLTSTTFGYLIGFLLPGIFGLYALSVWLPQAGAVLQPMMQPTATVGPSVIFLLISVGMGLCVNALRFIIFEKTLCRNEKLVDENFAFLTKENKLTTFKSVVDEHYRFHQFYGSCAVAVLIFFVGWLIHNLVHDWRLLWPISGFLFVELVLGYAGVDTFRKYVRRGTMIINETKEAINSTPANGVSSNPKKE